MCLDSRVELIFPDYPRGVIFPQSPKNVHTVDCPKLLKEPYNGTNYTVVFKQKATLNTLYYVITKIELAKQNDDALDFTFYYAARKRNKIFMIVEMSIKALEKVRKHNSQ